MRDKLMIRKGRKRIIVSIDEKLVRRLDLFSRANGQTRSLMVEDILNDYFERNIRSDIGKSCPF